MATQLFLRNDPADTHLGTNNVPSQGGQVGWISKALALTRGSGVVASDATPTTLGALDVQVGGTSAEWISPPVAADVTISGTITFNLWAAESNMSANVQIRGFVEVLRANALVTASSNTITVVANQIFASEMAVTTRAVNNFTRASGYPGITVNRGDRLRIRVGVANAVTGYTFNVSWNGTSAAADGDSYVSFTETISFESGAGTIGSAFIDNITSGTFSFFGAMKGASGASEERSAQSFVTSSALTLGQVNLKLRKFGAPTDTLNIEIQADSGGSPSGSALGTVATVAASGLTTTNTDYTYSCSIALSASSTYWIVLYRSGATDTTNYCAAAVSSTSTYAGGVSKIRDTGAWGSVAGDLAFSVAEFVPGSTVYLTDTASAVSTASVDKEAWTSRGSGVTSIVTNTSTGWTAPVQATATAGGTVVDWFTRPLTAFTLTGMAVLNIRALESNAAANASLRCEVARVEGDGTSPTVWSSWCCAPTGTDNGELTTSEVARTINLSGDDLAISDGQRLRIRLYNEDISSAAMVTGHTVTRYYGGTSGGASGDSYITFPQTLTEYASGPYTYEKAGFGKESG